MKKNKPVTLLPFVKRLAEKAPPLQYLYLSPMIPAESMTLQSALETSPDLKKVYATEPQAKKVLDEIEQLAS